MALDKESVTIAINRSTDSTPVFVAGTFSEPHWEPFELSAKRIPSSTEFVFSHDFEVSPGQYHYHFREGAGGAWFHDDAVKNGTYKQLILQNTEKANRGLFICCSIRRPRPGEPPQRWPGFYCRSSYPPR